MCALVQLTHGRAPVGGGVTAPPTRRRGASTTPRPTSFPGWEWLPLVGCVEASGLLTLAIADNANRASAAWADSLFWVSLVILFLPVVIRLLAKRPTRAERIGLVITLGMSLYVVKLLSYPVMFTYFDELLHIRTADDVLASHHLFTFNSLLPISALYPGLEIITTTLSQLTGFSLYTSGVIVIGMSRVLLLLALFLFYEGVSKSPRLAGIATLLYMTNPHFVFFEAQFAYESLAIGLGAFALCLLVDRMRATPTRRAAYTPLIWLALGALVVSHHLTSYATVGLMFLWAAIFVADRFGVTRHALRRLPQIGWPRRDATPTPTAPKDAEAETPATNGQRDRSFWAIMSNLGPTDVAVAGAVLALAWALATNGAVFHYITPQLTQAYQEFTRILEHRSSTRKLFVDYSGESEPLWEKIAAYSAVALVTLGLPPGLWHIWRRRRGDAAALALGVSGMLYPLSQLCRFTVSGSPIADRLPDYLFVGVAFPLATLVTTPSTFAFMSRALARAPAPPGNWARRAARLPIVRRLVQPRRAPIRLRRPHGAIERLALAALLLLIFVGGVVIGGGPNWNRMPGPYLVEADMRSMSSASIVAAQWTLPNLGAGNRFAVDRDNRLTLATYGSQNIVTSLGDNVDVSILFTSPTFDAADRALLRSAHIRYLLVDLRLTTGLPHVGVYFEQGEPLGFAYTSPLSVAALTKFGALPGVNCVYDSGDILIYDVGVYLDAS